MGRILSLWAAKAQKWAPLRKAPHLLGFVLMGLGACTEVSGAAPPVAPSQAANDAEIVLLDGTKFEKCPQGAEPRGYPMVKGALATYCKAVGVPSLRNGPFISFYPDGKRLAAGYYKEGNPDGVWTMFHQNGALSSQGAYARGVRVGFWKYEGDHGQPLFQEELIASAERVGGPSSSMGGASNVGGPASSMGAERMPEAAPSFDGALRIAWTTFRYEGTRLAEQVSFVKGPTQAGIRHGAARRLYSGGHLFSGQFQNGKGEGTWEEKTADKKVVVHLPMSLGFAEGKVQVYWPESLRLAAEGEMTKTLPIGVWTLYYAGGEKQAEITYEKGLLKALNVFYASGKASLTGVFVDGAPHGEWVSRYENGSLKATGKYVRGMRQGIWRTADEKGKTLSEGSYEGGVLTEGESVLPFLWAGPELSVGLAGFFADLQYVVLGSGRSAVDQYNIAECVLLGDPVLDCGVLDWKGASKSPVHGEGLVREEGGGAATSAEQTAERNRRGRQQALACAMNNPAACAHYGQALVGEAQGTTHRKKALAPAAGFVAAACDLAPLEAAVRVRDAAFAKSAGAFDAAEACVSLGKMLLAGEVVSKVLTPRPLFEKACKLGIAEGCEAAARMPDKAPSKGAAKKK